MIREGSYAVIYRSGYTTAKSGDNLMHRFPPRRLFNHAGRPPHRLTIRCPTVAPVPWSPNNVTFWAGARIFGSRFAPVKRVNIGELMTMAIDTLYVVFSGSIFPATYL